MENKVKIALIAITIIFIIAIVFILILSKVEQPLVLQIENINSEQAKYGDGRTLFMNITFKNMKEETARISNPMIITDSGRELYCDFIKVNKSIDFSPGKIELKSKDCIRATIKTWDQKNFSYCLLLNEKPAYFEYSYGSGIVFAPNSFKIEIPENLFSL